MEENIVVKTNKPIAKAFEAINVSLWEAAVSDMVMLEIHSLLKPIILISYDLKVEVSLAWSDEEYIAFI